MILLPQKVAYRGTISGLRISSVDGTAFLDACAALVPYADGNHLVEIYDASGRMLRGYLGAAGTGETTNAPLNVSNCANGSYSTFDGASSSGFHAIYGGSGTNTAGTADELAIVSGGLFKVVYTISGNTGQLANSQFRSALGGSSWSTALVTAAGANTFYINPSATGTGVLQFYSSTAAEYTVAGLSVGQVITPSTSGATIVTVKGGATANFAYKDASFTYNAASYYCLIKRAR